MRSMLEIVGAILGGVVSGAAGGWVAGAKSARRTLVSSTNVIAASDDSSTSVGDPSATRDDSSTAVTHSVSTDDRSRPLVRVVSRRDGVTSSNDPRSMADDPTTSIDLIAAEDDLPSSTGDVVPRGDDSTSLAGSVTESAGEVVTDQDEHAAEEALLAPAALSVELEEVGRGYFDLIIVNSGEGVADDTGVEITKTGSGGYSYLPMDGDAHDVGRLPPRGQRCIGQIVRTGGKGLLRIRATWSHPDGSSDEAGFAFE